MVPILCTLTILTTIGLLNFCQSEGPKQYHIVLFTHSHLEALYSALGFVFYLCTILNTMKYNIVYFYCPFRIPLLWNACLFYWPIFHWISYLFQFLAYSQYKSYKFYLLCMSFIYIYTHTHAYIIYTVCVCVRQIISSQTMVSSNIQKFLSLI